MTDVQSPPAPPITTPRFGRGRILRVLTLGKPHDSKTPRKTRSMREGQDETRDQRSSGESGSSSSQEGRSLAPLRTAASDAGSLDVSPLTSDPESAPPISPPRPEDHSPEIEDSPLTPSDPFSSSSPMNVRAAPPSPTFFKRFKTRLRSLSRGKDEKPKSIPSKRHEPPIIPNMPILKDFVGTTVSQPCSRASAGDCPVGAASQGNFLADLHNKSTPSLSSTAAQNTTVRQHTVPLPQTSSLPRLRAATSALDVGRPGQVDGANVPLPDSPLASPDEISNVTEVAFGAPADEKGKDTHARPQSGRLESPIEIATNARHPPVSAGSAAHSRSSKFFVGDWDDEDEDLSRLSAANSSPSPNPGNPRPRSATTDGLPNAGPARRPTRSSGPSNADKRKTMFSAWRKSADLGAALSDSRAHKRGPSIESVSSSDTASAARRVNPVSPTMHSGGFAHQEEKIKDPESRALTEIAFM